MDLTIWNDDQTTDEVIHTFPTGTNIIIPVSEREHPGTGTGTDVCILHTPDQSSKKLTGFRVIQQIG
jgi:hypothetical protein